VADPVGGNRTNGPSQHARGWVHERLLAHLLEEHRRTGFWPGRDAVARALGVSGPTVTQHRRRLILEGRLPSEASDPDRAHHRQAAFRLSTETQVLQRRGVVNLDDQVDLVDLLTGGDRACFAATVDTDTLAGPPHFLLPGSVVIVRPTRIADEGDLVLARVRRPTRGQPRTVLRQLLRTGEGKEVLRVSQSGAGDLEVEQVELLGVAVAVVRRLGS
jgi:hypothetical protein